MTEPEPVARGYNEDEIAAAEERFDALIDAGITAAVAAMVAAILAEPIPSMVTDATLQPLFTLWNAYTADVLVPELTRIFVGSGQMLIDTAGPVLLALSYELTGITPLDEPAAAWMAQASNRLRNVGNIVWEEIREQLVEGVKAGDGIPELAKRVQEAAAFSEIRARATARTEVAAASNGGSITQARALGLDMDKQWNSTVPTDGRTRTTHIAAHHQTVDLGAKFVVGNSELDFPGDPTGEAEEVINCRCAVTYLNIRRRGDTPEIAAAFVEAKHKRDTRGRFAQKRGSAEGWDDLVKGALRGAQALDSAPVRLVPAEGGHGGNYEGAQVSGPPGMGSPLALSEMEGVEHDVTNGILRGTYRLNLDDERHRERKAVVDDRVAELDKTMAVSPLPEPVITYRGIKDASRVFSENIWFGDLTDEEYFDKGLRPDLTGLTWREAAFTHTTVDEGAIGRYARKVDGDPVQMTIYVPAGTSAVQLSGMDLEAELMLDRGLALRIVADHGVDDAGVRQWDVEVIPDGD